MTASLAQRSAMLSDLLGPVVTASGYDLEDVSVTAAGRRSVVRVLVDRDGGAGLDDIAEVSRAVSDALDAADERDPALLGPSYVLEVSSPGVDRPLTAPRHWRRNVGRLVQVRPQEGAPFTGRVLRADEDAATLEVDGAERDVSYAQVVRATVEVEFSRSEP